MKKAYRVSEFAERAGVTVRALHHYDRLGLLKPARDPKSGYRLYAESDLGRLEQILMLKFFGIPLQQARDLLKHDPGLPSALRRQRSVLAGKQQRITAAVEAIDAALATLESNGHPQWDCIKAIIKEIDMENNGEWAMKYYNEEAKAKVEARRNLWSPELQEEVSKAWGELFRDVEAALGEDPAGAKAQALAARWRRLVGSFTGGDPEIQKGLNAMYADQANWPEARRRDFGIHPEVQEFMAKVLRASRAE